MNASELEARIRREIPALRDSLLQITALDAERIRVAGKLTDHLNHKGTAFGGSLYLAALLASYGLFFHLLEEAGCSTRDFVIAEGHIRYRSPVDGDFTAETFVPTGQREAFLADLRAHGQASLQMRAVINCRGQKSATLESRFKAFFPERNS